MTWREAAAILEVSSRTVARMVSRGELSTTFTTTGQRRLVRASVMTMLHQRQHGDTTGTPGKPKVDTPSGANTLELVADYATLRQACVTVLDSGVMGRRAALRQLRNVLQAAPDLRTPPALPSAATDSVSATNQIAEPVDGPTRRVIS